MNSDDSITVLRLSTREVAWQGRGVRRTAKQNSWSAESGTWKVEPRLQVRWAGRQTAIIVRHPNPCGKSVAGHHIIVSISRPALLVYLDKFRPHSQDRMSLFKVQEHTLTTSHIREYPGGTAGSQDDELKLAVKQYTPIDNQDPKPGDVTIIGGHANGFPKVLHFRGSYASL